MKQKPINILSDNPFDNLKYSMKQLLANISNKQKLEDEKLKDECITDCITEWDVMTTNYPTQCIESCTYIEAAKIDYNLALADPISSNYDL